MFVVLLVACGQEREGIFITIRTLQAITVVGVQSLFTQVETFVTSGWIASHTGLTQASDRRIKTDIVDADDLECLDTLRQLQPKKYKYKDVVNKGETPVWGFIAQEVRDALPYATNTKKFRFLYNKGVVHGDGTITSFYN